MKLNSYFINEYLTAGMTRDNFVFAEYNNEFLMLAYNSLSKKANDVKPCCVQLCYLDEQVIAKLFLQCKNELQKQLVAREYILQKVILSELENEPEHKRNYQKLNKLHSNLRAGDISALFSGYEFNNVQDLMEAIGRIELNFFLYDIKDTYLQQAINSYIASRTPYSVKIFSTNKLCTYYDLSGNFIECPHDYMTLSSKTIIQDAQNDNSLENH